MRLCRHCVSINYKQPRYAFDSLPILFREELGLETYTIEFFFYRFRDMYLVGNGIPFINSKASILLIQIDSTTFQFIDIEELSILAHH